MGKKDLLPASVSKLVDQADRPEWRRRVTPRQDRPRCGAKCRDGHLCRAPAVWDNKNDRPRNGRCRHHGGLSTGPRTAKGRRRSKAQLKYGRRR